MGSSARDARKSSRIPPQSESSDREAISDNARRTSMETLATIGLGAELNDAFGVNDTRNPAVTKSINPTNAPRHIASNQPACQAFCDRWWYEYQLNRKW